MALKIGVPLGPIEWHATRESVDGECPACGSYGSHAVMENDDDELKRARVGYATASSP